MRTAVVILNWNGAHFLREYLPGVVATTRGLAEVVVADNASTDGSIDLMMREFPDVHLVRLDRNHGFAQGYNLALAWVEMHLKSDYFVLLNSDVRTPEGWLAPLIARLEDDPTNAACMPKMRAVHAPERFEYAGAAGGFIDRLGYPFCRGRILGTLELDQGQYDAPIEVHWATGACLAIRAEAYWEVGGLCGGFFAHMEEIDLCWRLRRAGHRIWCEPAATVYHVGGGALPQESPFKLHLNYRNSLYMLRRNLPPRRARWLLPLRMCLDGLSALAYLLSGSWPKFRAVWAAHMAYWKNRRHFPYQPQAGEAGVYRGLIVVDYLLRRRRRWSELPLGPSGRATS